MEKYSKLIISLIFLAQIVINQPVIAQPDARSIIKSSIDYYRDVSSYSVAEMTIHRPDWERTMKMKVWTEGVDKSLVRIIAPKKDLGNGTLVLGDDMWSYTPKINRVIKLPSSMAHQGWMGSDFSNNDVAKADELVNEFTHTLIDTLTHEGLKLYIIESIPHEDAPVVWGKEITKVREDFLLIEQEFYDQDNQLIKKLTSSDIKLMDGKLTVSTQRMQKVDKSDEWTEFRLLEANYAVKIPKNLFTLSNLRNPRR